MADVLLNPVAAGEQLGMSPGSLAQMRYLGTGPRFVKLTKRNVRYRQSDIDAWIEANVRSQTGPVSA